MVKQKGKVVRIDVELDRRIRDMVEREKITYTEASRKVGKALAGKKIREEFIF